jgi:acetyl-CoA carboxylase carboxyl transferase subunit alpha
VIAPESCSSILWRGWEHKKEAAEALKLTSDHMHHSGIVDGVIEEPLGGAHTYPQDAAKRLKDTIKQTIAELEEMDSEERKQKRIEKYANMGHYQTSNKKGKSRNKKGGA